MIEDPEERRQHFYAASHENGPWMVDEWNPRTEGGHKRVVLQSDDFYHDAALEISGDFYDYEQKLDYARRLCARLNLMPPEIKD